MTKILLVDDDPIVVEIYRKKLQQHDYEVAVAEDGLAAIKTLQTSQPNLVVLDIMMPKLSGVEVLEFIRSKSELKNTRVVVLSNYYISGEDRQAATAKADLHFQKSACTPTRLLAAVSTLMAGSPPALASADTPPAAPGIENQLDAKVRRDFLRDAPMTMATLRQLNGAFIRTESPPARDLMLLDFYRKVHYVTAIAGMAGSPEIAHLASAFEALLLELHEKPDAIGPSTLQTIAFTLDFLGLLFANAGQAASAPKKTPRVLVVDDDPIAVRAAAMALQRAHLDVTGSQDPAAALQLLAGEPFDLILLDILMPGMDGLELCKRIRALSAYRRTPIIFVTALTDFQKRLQSVRSGGNDLIAKPIFPIELAVKAVTHLLRAQLPENLALA
ncbi:MAG: response regulator [Pedosphaera sp.]|nr:response regulator [Pedosphaera sp.]